MVHCACVHVSREIRSYFGESVAFYFAFLAFYNRALVLPALIGLALFIWQMVVQRVDVEGIVPYAILISAVRDLFLFLFFSSFFLLLRYDMRYNV